MRLLILASADAIHARRWVSWFRERGHEVMFATLEPSEGKVVQDEHPLPSYSSLKGLKYPMAAFSLSRLVKIFNPQLVNAHYLPGYGFLASLVPKARPLVISTWGSDVLINATRSPLHRLRARFALRAAELVTCDAAVVGDTLNKLGVDSPRILETPMGIDPELFYPPEKKEPCRGEDGRERPLRIISTRRHEPLYDVESLLRATVILRESGRKFEIEVAGDGTERGRLESFAERHHLKELVHFTGLLSSGQLAEALRKADIYISTSRSDSTSVSLLEAMASGVFPVVTDIKGNTQWIEHGRNGLTFPPGDFGSLSERLARAFENESLRLEAVEKNLETVRSKALWEDNMKVVEEAFRKKAGE
ncbi:MAG: glycosyltransferase [Gemmatimonadota bacterium]|nr:glycosyltransferase [Gemmatimonadota bacterium]